MLEFGNTFLLINLCIKLQENRV